MRDEVVDWFEEAKADLKHAEKSLEIGDYSWACFAAQQAAEKALKAAFLTLKRSRAPKTHDLTELSELLKAKLSHPKDIMDKLSILSSYYALSRYPNAGLRRPSRSLTRRAAEEAIRTARGVVRTVGKTIGLT